MEERLMLRRGAHGDTVQCVPSLLGGRTLCFLYTDVCALRGSVTWKWRSNWKVDFTSGHRQEEGRVELLGLASSRGS